MKKLLLAMLLVALATPALYADTYIKTKSHTDAMEAMSVPARDEISETWIAGNKMATVSSGMTFVVNIDKNVAYMINHASKSYVEMALPIDFMKLLPPEAAQMAPMMQMKATVAPTTETKKIGQWDCTAYDATITMAMGMTLKQRVWASTQVPFDVAAFNAKLMPAMMAGMMRLDPASANEFAKVKGYQIASETTSEMMGMKIRATTEVTEIVEKAAPAGIYDAPAGYTKKTTLSMEDLQRR